MSCLTSDSIQPVPLPQTWRLVKLHKAATLAEHREAAEAALGMPNLCLGMPYVSFYFCPFNVNFEKKNTYRVSPVERQSLFLMQGGDFRSHSLPGKSSISTQWRGGEGMVLV